MPAVPSKPLEQPYTEVEVEVPGGGGECQNMLLYSSSDLNSKAGLLYGFVDSQRAGWS